MKLLTVFLVAIFAVTGQVGFDRIAGSQGEPQNWLTYNGSLQSTHYSALDQIKSSNVAHLELKWVSQVDSLEKFEATPLVVDGVMYVTEPAQHSRGARYPHGSAVLAL